MTIAGLLAGLAALGPAISASAATKTASVGVADKLSLSDIVPRTREKMATDDVTSAACYVDVIITSQANGGLVSAELGYGGGDYAMLRARASAVGPWERYTVCLGSSYDTITSQANGRLVSAELGYGGGDYAMLRARASAVGPWEKFRFESCGSGCVTIWSLANNRLVSAELGYGGGDYGMLRARATNVGPWERFQ